MVLPYEILRNENVFQNYFKLTINITTLSIPKPGQFYNIRCSRTTDPLLRRPFSLHRLIEDGKSVQMEILYRATGKGTQWLSWQQKGECLQMLGPLGNGFLIEENINSIVLVARGIGIAPLYALGEEALKKDRKKQIFILMGARFEERVFYEEKCKGIGEVFLYTDDGSKGFHGRAPDLLLHLIEKKRLPEQFSLFACGPDAMYQDLEILSKRFKFRAQVSLTTHLGCGFGACLSCVCPLNPPHILRNDQWKKPALQWSEDGSSVYSLICKDGPVYDLQEVDWDEWIT